MFLALILHLYAKCSRYHFRVDAFTESRFYSIYPAFVKVIMISIWDPLDESQYNYTSMYWSSKCFRAGFGAFYKVQIQRERGHKSHALDSFYIGVIGNTSMKLCQFFYIDIDLTTMRASSARGTNSCKLCCIKVKA